MEEKRGLDFFENCFLAVIVIGLLAGKIMVAAMCVFFICLISVARLAYICRLKAISSPLMLSPGFLKRERRFINRDAKIRKAKELGIRRIK